MFANTGQAGRATGMSDKTMSIAFDMAVEAHWFGRGCRRGPNSNYHAGELRLPVGLIDHIRRAAPVGVYQAAVDPNQRPIVPPPPEPLMTNPRGPRGTADPRLLKHEWPLAILNLRADPSLTEVRKCIPLVLR